MTLADGSPPVDVLVVGGGLAGIAAALRLAESGASVALAEARPRLGGATYSFRRGDLTVDTGQHVFLRCYTAYRRLLEQLGTIGLTDLQDRFEVVVRDPYGGTHRLARARRLRAPPHLAPAIARYGPLSPLERLRALRTAGALRGVDPDDPAADARDLGSWLRARGQSAAAVRRLWAPFAVAALNVAPEEASLALAARVFRTGLLESAAAGDIGIPAVPLEQLHAAPAARELTRRGVALHLRARVESLHHSGGRFHARVGGSELLAAAVVVAVPHAAAARLVPAAAVPDKQRWQLLGAAPIVDLHLRYDERVCDWPFFAAVDSPVQWVFDRGPAVGLDAGQYLVCSLSAADTLVSLPAREILRRLLPAVADLLPATRRARLVDGFVTREPRATFRQRPGTGALRPPTATRLPGLVLAGAWTATGWPDTMEGAVRSGRRAADLLAGRRPAPSPAGEPAPVGEPPPDRWHVEEVAR